MALTGSPEVTQQPTLVEQWRGPPVFAVGKATAQAGMGRYGMGCRSGMECAQGGMGTGVQAGMVVVV